MPSFKLFYLFVLLLTALSIQPLFAVPMDHEINFNVIGQIARDYQVGSLTIEVTTNKRIVHLRGVAYTNENASKLVQIAASTAGVNDVDTSQLTLEYGKAPASSSILIGKILGKYIRYDLCEKDRCKIKVVITRNIVFLSGVLRSPIEAQKAVCLTSSVKGVHEIVAKFKIAVPYRPRFSASVFHPIRCIWC
ncbi:MAG: hypothetical protein A3F14_03075 [Gammaproteobacteria bacterium RIFCSPHIGHO2_12_FULL_43_28]|nr:MAG: hypothetical protein A3F14_03075 [Gammaproteobacteria bacterium RIFCSPHIGHO2_12_FULL_43_28]